MQTLELVNIEDVYPFEYNDQRMNPRDFSTKETREYVARLAEQFKANRLNPGQPRVKPILFRDGGIYQIVDGECRYNAMRLLGTKRFWADVYDDLADAELARQEAAKAMVETDAKLCLSPAEMSRGVQTMLALDVPEEEVAAASGVDVSKVRRVRRAARVVEDAAYDMTIDRLLAIADFEGDEQAVAEIASADAKDWQQVYQMHAQRREHERLLERARELCEELGVAVVEDAPEGWHIAHTTYLRDVERLPEHARAGMVAVVGNMWLELFEPAADGTDTDAEREEYFRERERFHAAWDDACGRFGAWVAERVAEPERMPQTARRLMVLALESVECFTNATGVELPPEPSGLGVCVGMARLRWPHWADVLRVIDVGTACIYRPGVTDMVGVYEAMVEDGYEPTDEEARGMDALAAWVEGEE